MKQIFNWTAGAFFRSVGRFLFFVLIGGLFAFLVSKSGLKVPDFLNPLMIVNAEEVNYSYGKWRANNNGTWTGPDDFGTNASSVILNGISARFGWSTKFQAGTTYRMVVESGFASYTIASEDIGVLSPISVNCYGSTSTGSWSADASLIANCDYIGATRVTNSNHVKYIIDITPLSTIIGLQVNINYDSNDRYTLSSVNVYKSSSISYGESVSGAIDEQTIVIQNEFNDLEQTIINNNQTLIDSITENNTTCESVVITQSTPGISYGALNSSCRQLTSSTALVTPYYRVTSSSVLTGLRTGGYVCFYDDSKSFISRSSSSASTMTIPSNAKYVKFQISNNTQEYFRLYSCMSNTESTNGKIEDLTDTFTDTDTDDDTNSIYNQMHDFNLSIEGPLTSIINVPIQLLDDLLVDYTSTDSHADLCFTLKGVESCIPSGDILWKRTSSGVHDNRYYWFGTPDFVSFRSFFELVVGGYLTYLLLKKLVNSIEKGLDPTINEVKIMNL